jgi:BirA family biotin operon repressor/biotin-[acetyl-CoA-carboxylase] ligase
VILIRLESCLSTNDEAKRLARQGAPGGTAVVAGAQTAGRGTRGRFWHSPPGLGLYMSIIIRPPIPDLVGLPMRAALAVRGAVRAAPRGAAAGEPPNDLVIGGRKLGGILCESAFEGGGPEFAIVGVGLNVDHGPEDFPPELAGTAVSLRMVLDRRIDSASLIEPIRGQVLRFAFSIRLK